MQAMDLRIAVGDYRVLTRTVRSFDLTEPRKRRVCQGPVLTQRARGIRMLLHLSTWTEIEGFLAARRRW